MEYNTVIVEGLLLIMGALITRYAVPWLINTGLYFWVKVGVKAAEEIYAEAVKAGKFKEDWVRKFLDSKGIKISEELLMTFIKAAVTELKKG